MRLFWLIVLVPLALAAWLGVKVAHDERALEKHGLERLLQGRLVDVRSRAGQAVGRLERELLAALDDAPAEVDGLRELGRRTPIARQIFVLGPDGQLVFPARTPDASRDELDFLARTEAIWSGRAVLLRDPGDDGEVGDSAPAPAPPPPATRIPGDSLIHLAATRPHGWISWYWQEGLHLLFWRRSAGGRVIGLEVERIALLSRIVAALPTTELEAGRMRLADSRGAVVHQWGPHEAGDDEVARAVLTFEHPLDTWRLEYFIAPSQRRAFEGGIRLDVIFGIGAVAIALIGLAIYTHREMSRRVRDASQRVSFVTQVSHELKTPLTNIRLYAELLEERLDSEDRDNARRAGVIVSESQRLTRLINNILTFARARRGELETRPGTVDPNRVVREVLEQFGPALAAHDLEVATRLEATSSVRAGEDALDQILANLVSNVEKYAAVGGTLGIESRDEGDRVVIRVADQGPGIPRGQREAIFRPFVRLSDRLADGVTGTGIGLSIARELARSVGGELRLVDAERGACFEISLVAAPPGAKEDERESAGS
ncbi:MAG TPA: HAMP domain-containing sensor histidine kinase [Kofleriaceae bacterium]|nr:HAMP domain-containing sensor histidine kinase [Kofleriaceae bacterium]